jgi:hypothetical protein
LQDRTQHPKKPRMFNMNANNNSQIDFNLLPKNCPSLCIPRVFSNIGEARIRKIFEDISIGRIEEIDIIKGNKNNRVFIHLTWNNTPDAQFVRNQVMTGKDVKIIYDEPWYWMISAARNQPPKPQPPQQPQLSHKTDEYGRELRQAPLPKPILRRQVCFHEVPPPPPAPLQRQKACFEPPPRHVQLRHQEPRHRQLIPRQEQQQTDQFGREIRRPQPPTTPPPPPSVPSPAPMPSPAPKPPTTSTKTKMQPWHLDEYDEDDEEYNLQELQRIKERVQREQQEAKEFVPPPPPPPQRFIPQSPTTTPPCLIRKQIQPEEDHQEPEDQEQEPEDQEQAPRAPPKLDVDEMSKPVAINYGSVLPIKKIRKSRRTVTK